MKGKELAEYLGWTYIPFNSLLGASYAGWWKECNALEKNARHIDGKYYKYISRNIKELVNDYNWLFKIIEKLEKEDLSEYFYPWDEPGEGKRSNFEGIEVSRFHGVWDVSINLALDPCMEISEIRREKEDKEQLFLALVDAVNYINNLKNSNGKR